MNGEDTSKSNPPVLAGEVTRMPTWKPIRIFLIVTGLILVRNTFALIARYCLGLRGKATVSIKDNTIILAVEWTLLGRRFRRTKTAAPVRDVAAVRFENRQRYLYLLVGIGALVVGTLVGTQWFLDGLRAGYPYLVLVGAGVVAAGIAVDLLLYIFIPNGEGRSHLILALGPWTVRIIGVSPVRAEAFLRAVENGWRPRKLPESQ